MNVPHDRDAEQSVLSSCLLKNNAITTAVNMLDSSDFFIGPHRIIFDSMLELFNEGTVIDLVTLSGKLKQCGKIDIAGGPSYLVDLTSNIIAPSNIVPYCKMVKDKSKARELIKMSSVVIAECQDGSKVEGVIDELGKKFFDIATDKSGTNFNVSGIADDVLKEIERRHKDKTSIVGMPSGFADIDKMLHGFAPKKFYLLAARPSMGKTTLAVNMMLNGADRGRNSLFFSLEMDKEDIVMNQLASLSGVDSEVLRLGALSDHQWPRLVRAVGKLKSTGIVIDDTPSLSITQIRARSRMVMSKQEISAIFIDYIGLAKANESIREREISEISAGLKAMAKELGVAVIALSQLNRKLESREDKRPLLSDLRDSGSLEQDSDVAIFIYCDDRYNDSEDNPMKGIAEIIIRKNRTGMLGTRELYFDRATSTFRNHFRES